MLPLSSGRPMGRSSCRSSECSRKPCSWRTRPSPTKQMDGEHSPEHPPGFVPRVAVKNARKSGAWTRSFPRREPSFDHRFGDSLRVANSSPVSGLIPWHPSSRGVHSCVHLRHRHEWRNLCDALPADLATITLACGSPPTVRCDLARSRRPPSARERSLCVAVNVQASRFCRSGIWDHKEVIMTFMFG